MIAGYILLQTEGDGQGGFDPTMMIFVFAFLGIMYFFMLRPQQKRAKEQKAFMADLAKGQRVVTNGGIHGRIVKVDEDSFLVEVDQNMKLRLEKSAISMELTKERFGAGDDA